MAKLQDKKIYPVWDCGVFNGRVVIRDREAFDNHLIPYEGKDNLQLVLRKKVKARSRKEEKFFHAVVCNMVAGAMDITMGEAKELLKRLFLTVEERTPAGMRYTRVMSTTELGDVAYREFWEQCIRWAVQPTDENGLSETSGLGLWIPYPNEADWDGRDEYFAEMK